MYGYIYMAYFFISVYPFEIWYWRHIWITTAKAYNVSTLPKPKAYNVFLGKNIDMPSIIRLK